MAKKQTRRSISVSRVTYERLKAFCEANNVSMSQLVETRVNDYLVSEGSPLDLGSHPAPVAPVMPRPAPMPMPMTSYQPPMPPRALSTAPMAPMTPRASTEMRPMVTHHSSPVVAPPAPVQHQPAPAVVPMTSAAARIAVEPPPPIIKPRQETAAPKPAEKRPEQIFTF